MNLNFYENTIEKQKNLIEDLKQKLALAEQVIDKQDETIALYQEINENYEERYEEQEKYIQSLENALEQMRGCADEQLLFYDHILQLLEKMADSVVDADGLGEELLSLVNKWKKELEEKKQREKNLEDDMKGQKAEMASE